MKKNFSDYHVYRLEDSPEAHMASCLIYSTKALTTPEKDKVLQILSSVNVHEGEFEYKVSEPEALLHTLNALPSEKVSRVLVFSDDSQFEKFGKYEVTFSNDLKMIWSDPVSELISDEQQGKKERRKALWMALKQWA